MPSYVASRIAVGRLSMAVSGNRMSVDLPFGCDSDVDDVHLRNVRDVIKDDLVPILQLAMSQDVHFQDVYVRPLLPAQANPVVQPFITTAGLVAQDSLPSNIALVMKQIQAMVPSRHNGRIFFPGVAVTQTDDGILNNAALVGVWKSVSDWWVNATSHAGHDYWPLIVSKFDNGAPIAPIGYTVAQAIIVPELATQRRRTTELREGHA